MKAARPGVFFTYSMRNRKIVLADRGQGVLTTLKQVRPHLTTAREALTVAFTETISGRYPETRGNGLKFVRSIIVKHPLSLFFRSGDSQLHLAQGDKEITPEPSLKSISGCFAVISFEQ